MTTTGKRVGYIRVSTTDQNTARQLEGIELDKIYTDICSGKSKVRPQLKAMLEYVRDDDIVIVHSMDRLARNIDDLRSIVSTLNSRKVAVQFIKENLTFTGNDSPMANLLLSVMGAVAQFERELINERIREGVAIAQKAGKYKKRGKDFSTEQIEEMRQMVAERYKKVDIAKKYGINRSTLHRYLKSEN